MTETTGEIKPTQRPFEENAYKYADEQAELYRGLKEPSGGYANIVDAYIAGAKSETKELKKENAKLKFDLNKKENTVHTLDVLHKEAVRKYGEVNDQLTKAKELIENIIRVTWGEGWNYSLDWKVKAEQFLREE